MDLNQQFLKFLLFSFFVMGSACSTQRETLNHSFIFLDKWGMATGYEIEYLISSKKPINSEQRQEVLKITEDITRQYGRDIQLTEFVSKRDSIEEKLIADFKLALTNTPLKIHEIEILNILVPKPIAEALMSRDGELIRIKVIE